MENALFIPDGTSWRPTELARGPWNPRALHGGPVAALVVRDAQRVPRDVPMAVARLTLELMRPVPVAALAVDSRVVRAGHRVQLVETTVTGEDQVVARAVTLFLRVKEVPLPEGTVRAAPPAAAPPAGGPAMTERLTRPGEWRAYHNTGVEMRFAGGRRPAQGPATAWIRLRVPVVVDEDPTPVERAAAAADFGNGLSGVLPHGRYSFINPELTMHVVRPPEGEWVCAQASGHVAGLGSGFAESTLYDSEGVVGRATQAFLVETAR